MKRCVCVYVCLCVPMRVLLACLPCAYPHLEADCTRISKKKQCMAQEQAKNRNRQREGSVQNDTLTLQRHTRRERNRKTETCS